MKRPIALYAFVAAYVILPYAFGLRAPVSVLSLLWIALAVAMFVRGYRWAWGILIAVQVVALLVGLLAAAYNTGVATVAAAALMLVSFALLFSPSVLRYIDQCDAARARTRSVR